MNFPPTWRFRRYTALRDRTESARDVLRRSASSEEFLRGMSEISDRTIAIIERKTRGQSENPLWFRHRAHIITGSTCKALNGAAKKNRFDARVKGLIAKLVAIQRPFPALKWGCENESVARDDFITRHRGLPGFSFEERGLQLASGIGYFAASVDGLYSFKKDGVFVRRLLEIKCPFRFSEQGNLEHDGTKLEYLDGNLQLKRVSSYYSQIQFYLHIYGMEQCTLLIWCPRDFLELEIFYDTVFCTEMFANLKRLYEERYAPSLFRE